MSFSRSVKLHALLLLAIALSTGCTTARFLWQAGWGHLDVVTRAEPIDRLLRSGRVPPELRALLSEVEPIKRFATRHGLAAPDNYRAFAEVDREAVVWSVSACAPLAFEPHTWTFPIVGVIPYVGWFEPGAAEAYALELRAEGLDVNVRAVSAYSTLGWMEDPFLSTMITRGPSVTGDLVNIVLHESVHATIYVADQAVFNESLASFVADGLTPDYLAERFGSTARESRAYRRAARARRWELALLADAYAALDAIYRSALKDAVKLAQKATLLERLKADLGTDEEINNATLIDFATYRSGEAELRALLAACNQDWPRFLAAVQTVEDIEIPEQANLAPLLRPLIDAGCP